MTTAFKPASTAAAGSYPGATGGPTQSPTATPLVNSAENQKAPVSTPAAWGLTPQTLTTPLYVGDTTKTLPGSPLKRNQLMGQIADKLGIKPKKGLSLQEQIYSKLATQVGIRGETGKENSIRNQIISKLGINSEQATGDYMPQIAQKLGVSMTGQPIDKTTQQTTTVGKVASQLYQMNKTQIQSLQVQLWQGGFYDEDVEGVGGTSGPDAKKLTPGNLDPYTMKAFGNLLSQTADANKKGVAVTWSQALSQAAETNAQGATVGTGPDKELAALEGTPGSESVASMPEVKLATSDQLQSTLQEYFESKLGRMPTQAELDQFTDQMRSAQTTGSKYLSPTEIEVANANGTATTGVAEVPGVPRASEAAQEFAQSDNTEYMGHQLSNAGALLLHAMGVTSGLGTNPNVTAAG